MAKRSNNLHLVSPEGNWVQDALKMHPISAWAKRMAVGFTILSCFLYGGLFVLIWDYRLQVAEHIRDFPIFTRIVLNISQPFLVVFIIISLSLWILWQLTTNRCNRSYTPLLVLIIANCVIAAVLIGISLLGTRLMGF